MSLPTSSVVYVLSSSTLKQQNPLAIRYIFYQPAWRHYKEDAYRLYLNLLAPELLFLILAHPVYKMWIIQEPNTLELLKKLHFEEKKTESVYHV